MYEPGLPKNNQGLRVKQLLLLISSRPIDATLEKPQTGNRKNIHTTIDVLKFKLYTRHNVFICICIIKTRRS